MPIFEYLCNSCGNRFELLQSGSDNSKTQCPLCGKIDVVKTFSTFTSAGIERTSGNCGGSTGFS